VASHMDDSTVGATAPENHAARTDRERAAVGGACGWRADVERSSRELDRAAKAVGIERQRGNCIDSGLNCCPVVTAAGADSCPNWHSRRQCYSTTFITGGGKVHDAVSVNILLIMQPVIVS